MLSSLWLAFGLLGCASAIGSSVIWEQRERSAIVKLDTPGYPLTTLRIHSSPPTRYKKAEKYYEEVPGVPSALLLNITMGHDNKTLFINQEMVFPFQDYNRPPRIGAYQIRADMSRGGILHMKKLGLLNREQEGVTLDYRYLELDYDRLVRGDPEQGPWINASPELTFRVMGIGAHSRNTILDDSQQEILHIRLIDANHGMSDSPHRSFFLANIKFLRPDDQYFFDIPVVELAAEKKECTWTSWRCPDFRLYEDGAPYYRYIWRERFDKYGRVGSGRWLLVKKLWVLIELWDGAGAAMVMSFGILMSIAMAVLGGIRFARYWAVCKERKRAVDEMSRADEEERLIEAIVNEVEDGEEKLEQPDRDKPLPPLPQNEQREEVVADLIDLESDDEGRV